MTKYALTALHPGVTPIPGEPLRYYVSSRSRSMIQHVVDLQAYNGNGECSCEAFTFGLAPKMSKQMPSIGTECRHIREAKRYLALQVIRKTLANAAERKTVRT